MAAASPAPERKPPRSLFDVPSDFFDAAHLLRAHPSSSALAAADRHVPASEHATEALDPVAVGPVSQSQWTCKTCGAQFESLLDQRAHFKSDLHRLNVKLSVAGKRTLKEEEFDEQNSDTLFQDFEVSSISGSEDELENGNEPQSFTVKGREEFRKKLYFRLRTDNTVSLWRCLLFDESEEPSFDNKLSQVGSLGGSTTYVEEDEMINRLKRLISEPRDKTQVRIVLLVSGGHFAGCVFDGNSILAQKTFHRYVVRAKAGKRQSGKDATGKVAHSAGSSLRRYNEAALKKEVHDLIVSWKPYFDACKCAFVYAPSKNRQIYFDAEKTQSILEHCDIRNIPLTVHRPTLKEAKRVYTLLTQVNYEIEFKYEVRTSPLVENDKSLDNHDEEKEEKHLDTKEPTSDLDFSDGNDDLDLPSSENRTTALHEAAKSGNAQQTLELLEQGLDPCIKDERGKTPYMLAADKEVRDTFRRFMALNLDKWDWHAAKVPSALTKEMEELQAAKQAEKDAKRKARAKELKKLKKAKEKAKLQAEQAAQSQAGPKDALPSQPAVPALTVKQKLQTIIISKEEEQRRKLAEEREKRAAAAERRMAALAAQSASTSAAPPSHPAPKTGVDDMTCSYCSTSLAGKVPFHRYNYKYCTTTCMHVHREMLEDG